MRPAAVDVLVPAYRAAEFIEETLASLAAQSFSDLRVLVSVDLCDDATYAVCADYAGRDPRFRVERQESRLGWMGNCNYLIGQATADYALIVGHDDIVAPDYVAKLHAAIASRPEVVLSYSDIEVTHIDGSLMHWSYEIAGRLRDPVRRASWLLRSSGWWVAYRGMFRVAAARRTGGLRPHRSGEYGGELPWLFHLCLLGEFARVAETLYFKRVRCDGLTNRFEVAPASRRRNLDLALACRRQVDGAVLAPATRRRLIWPLARRQLRGMVVDFMPARLRCWLHYHQSRLQEWRR